MWLLRFLTKHSFCLSFCFLSTSHSGLLEICPHCGCCPACSFLLTVFISYYSHEGSSPSPAALSATEDLIFFAILNGYLSPKYIQPFLLKEETCLVPQHSEIPKKGQILNLKYPALHYPPNIFGSVLLLDFQGFLGPGTSHMCHNYEIGKVRKVFNTGQCPY